MIEVSAIVLSYNAGAHLARCLSAIMASFDRTGVDGEILVVENGSADASVATLAAFVERDARVTAIYLPRNLGTTVSRNRAAALARGRYLLIVDADAVVDPTALRWLIDGMEDDHRIGVIAPRLTYGDGRTQTSTHTFPSIRAKTRRLLRPATNGADAEAGHTQTRVDYAVSACWLTRRSLWERLRGMDENIFYSPEDADYCARVWLAGSQVIYDPRATVVHHASELSRRNPLGLHARRHLAGLIYFFRKFGCAFGHDTLRRRMASASIHAQPSPSPPRDGWKISLPRRPSPSVA